MKATVAVPSAGEHTVQVWMREDGINLDRIVLTADAGFTPTGTGPAATPRDDAGPDTTPPTLAGRTPPAGATGVAVNANVVATFSEAMDPATVTASSFTLAPDGGGPAIPAAITASAGNTVFTLNPSADLTTDTHYLVTVGTGVTDAAGNPLAAPASWLFTTAAPAPAGGSGPVTFAGGLAVIEAEDHDVKAVRSGDDWVAGTSPSGAVGQSVRALPDNGTAATGDVVSNAPELGYRVDFPAAGTYYLWLRGNGPDGAGNSVHTGLGGSLAPSYHFVNTYGVWSWLGKAFSGARATVVVPGAGVHTVNVWSREDGFGLDRLLLTADAGYTPTGDGPAATPRDIGPDTSAPTLAGRQPAPGATGVAAGANVVATFSEPMNPATVTFTLAPSAGGPAVAASVAASSGDAVFTLDPAAPLEAETTYTASVATGATDVAGNPIGAAQTWSFTTAAPPPSDTTPPVLTDRQPAAGATGVAVSANAVATFSEAMDPATLTGAAFTLAPSAGGPAVAASVTASAGNTVFTLNPSADLTPGTAYTVRVAETAADVAGNPLGAGGSWSFSTSSSTSLVATDIAGQAGVRDTTGTQGENCVFDFDGDGIRDLFLSTHGVGWRLMRGRPDGTFAEFERFPGTDRHGCAIGDFGGVTASGAYTGPDGRPDIYATVGACQGTCTTPFPNELWLQRPGGDYLPSNQDQLEGSVPSGNKANAGSDAAKAFGVADERGRGREPLGFDIGGDGLTDLFVGNEESELYFSANRLFANDGDGDMSAFASSAVVQEVGSLASWSGDIDGDGRADLANVGTSRLSVFRNTGSGFQDVTTSWALPTGGDAKDIEFADLNDDGRLDAIIANHTSLKVRLNRDGRFPAEDHSRSVSQGRDLAIGDADGDGDLDIYLVLGQNQNYDDVLLRNGGRALSTGKWEFTTISIPQVNAGEGDTAQAIPGWAGTNRAAFLVNNGKWDGRGARQLIFMN